MSDNMTDDVAVSRCVSAAETRQAYLALVGAELHGKGNPPCMRDDCEHCGPLNALIDLRSDECDARGCTVARCVYGTVPSDNHEAR